MSFSSPSASLRSMSGHSSTASHKIKRGVAKTALDAANLSMGIPLETQRGDKFDSLKNDLGEGSYSRLRGDAGFSIEAIHYCQRGLSSLQGHRGNLSVASLSENGYTGVSEGQVEKIRQMRSVINHDYLVVEVQPGETDAGKLYILAHKLGRGAGSSSDSKAGIHISLIPADQVSDTLHTGVQVYSVRCGKLRIQFKKLTEVLKEANPHYSLRDNNCWDYATATTKRLLEKCIHVDGISTGEKARLQTELNDLEGNLNSRQMMSTFKSVSDTVLKVPISNMLTSRSSR